MAKAQFKLLIFLLTVGLMLGSVATAVWFYVRVIRPEWEVQEEIANLESSNLPPVDPGARRFDAAVELIRGGKLEEGREALYKLVAQFKQSPTVPEAKRIIGEMNLDRFFSPTDLTSKIEHTVQPGDLLSKIASKYKVPMDAVTRMNGLRSETIHIGDHLVILPLDFDFVVDVSDKTVVVLRNDRFFAEFPAVDVRLPPGFRVPSEMKLGGKSATVDEKSVSSFDPRYPMADKWVPGEKAGALFRPVPRARVVAEDTPTTPAKAEGAESGMGPPQEYGIFLAREDLEEIFALARQGAKLRIVN